MLHLESMIEGYASSWKVLRVFIWETWEQNSFFSAVLIVVIYPYHNRV